MTIRNWEAYKANLWDWNFLEEKLPGSCAVSDIDGIIERNGRFLVIETKGPEVAVPMGQSIMFSAIARLPEFTVWVVWGTPGKVTHMQRWGEAKFEAESRDLQDTIRLWFKLADSMPHAPRPAYTVGG